jgi:hypothetical protein
VINPRCAPVAVALAAFVLSGCTLTAPSPTDHLSGQTLAETKTPVQLLRNDVIDRIPGAVVTVATLSDSSRACFPVANDPDGIYRSWVSTADLSVAAGAMGGVDTIVDNILSSLAARDWTAEPVDVSGLRRAYSVVNAASVVTIRLGVEASANEEAPTVLVESRGPCVRTEGASSNEVKTLEGK